MKRYKLFKDYNEGTKASSQSEEEFFDEEKHRR